MVNLNQRAYLESCQFFLPTSPTEIKARGWKSIDVLLISGDAYVDHPTFGIACLGRILESMGLKVAILPQPKWDTLHDFQQFPTPRLFVGISAGTVDSMINNYTANKKKRSDDMYSENGLGGNRPDYASIVYSDLARKAFPESIVIVGGVEASLRRLAHYDYWQNRVRPSILAEWVADFLVFGMGDRTIRVIIEELLPLLNNQTHISRNHPETQEALQRILQQRGIAYVTTQEKARELQPRLTIPSFEEVRDNKKKFAKAAYFIEYEASPYNGKRLIQYHGKRAVVVNTPAIPLTTPEFDAIYELPFTKQKHPRYKGKIPAADMIRFSVASTRGCFGGCSFCAITLHQGRIVQSRSTESILKEVEGLNKVEGFKGIVSDIGGPTANMYQLRCKSPDIQKNCRKLSCVHPKVCPHLHKDHTPQVDMLRKARKIPGIRKIHIASGLRYDLSISDEKSGKTYMKELIENHVGGHLKVAPEHLDDDVLHLMKKPGLKNFDEFVDYFDEVSKAAGKEQYIVPYFISGFPGTTHEKMEKVYGYLKEQGWNLQQVQAFIPTPMTLATAMYYSGYNPMGMKPLYVAKEWKDRKIQQALLQPHKPQNKEILQRYRQEVRKREVEGGARKDFGTNDFRPSSAKPNRDKIVNPPKNKMGQKLLLDTR